ncbi:ATP synthase protein I [Gammaproteobacteria bacterium]
MIPFYIGGGLLLGFWMGGWADRWLGTTPYLSAVFMVLGLISGGRESWQIANRFAKSQDQNG